MTDLSLNEFEVTCRKAGVGSGLPDGVAAILARAATWLERRGFDGAVALAAGLGSDGPALAALPGQAGICVATGAATTNAVPPLLAVGACAATMPSGTVIEATWPGGRAVVTTTGARIDNPGDAAMEVQLRTVDPARLDLPAVELASRVRPSRDAWAALGARARLTLVPASAHSRAAGAGAGDIDND